MTGLNGGSAAPLGTITESASGVGVGEVQKWREATRKKHKLRASARKLLLDHRIAVCNRWVKDGREVEIYRDEKGRASYQGLIRCGDSRACAVCAAKIAEVKRKEIKQAREQWEAEGNSCVIVAYTVSHKLTDSIDKTVADFDKVRKAVRSGDFAVKFKERWGIHFSVLSKECTYGMNGYHPHGHELLFVKGKVNAAALESELRREWCRVANKKGNPVLEKIGVVVQAASEYIDEYITKFGHDPAWACDEEMTKGAVKVSRSRKGRSMFALLEDFQNGDEKAGKLFRAYIIAMKGKALIYWSKGARSYFGLGKEKTDLEAVEAAEEGRSYFMSVKLTDWMAVVEADLQAELLILAGRGDVEVCRQFVAALPRTGYVIGTIAMKSRPFKGFDSYMTKRLKDAVETFGGFIGSGHEVPTC
jgi:hypothetical protein